MLKLHDLFYIYVRSAEAEKDGEPRNQVPEEGSKSEEGWHEILSCCLIS